MKLARTREWRESRGLTQREVAERAGVSEVTIIRVEMGHDVFPATARKIAEALDVQVADLQEAPPVPLASAPGTGPQQKCYMREAVIQAYSTGILDSHTAAVSQTAHEIAGKYARNEQEYFDMVGVASKWLDRAGEMWDYFERELEDADRRLREEARE